MKENKANKKGRKLLWGTVIITMILSFMFFYVLYCSNNKYMTREEKAIHGLLYADGSYESFPVYYLSREWEYYPDALLTPEDDLDKYYFRYISIGEYGGMELGNSERSPYGSGTYRLKIMLPAEQHTYGLYLPEIFSAYNLYVDGVLVGQMGNPDPDHYVERTQNRMFTFKANTSLEILIAVTDKSSASPGIQSVPVFGNPLKINTIRGIAVFINSSVFTLIILVLAFSVWAFFKTRSRANVLFAGVCLCVLGYTCYPLLHTYLALRVQPWFSVEMLFYFLAFPAMLLLEYLKFVADLKKIPKDKKATMIEEIMDMVKITDMKNRLIKNLSKGYRQRVGIAQAVLGYPEVIILDEPTVGLDPKQINEIRDLIKGLKQKHTVILSSHILSEVSAVCDYVLILTSIKINQINCVQCWNLF